MNNNSSIEYMKYVKIYALMKPNLHTQRFLGILDILVCRLFTLLSDWTSKSTKICSPASFLNARSGFHDLLTDNQHHDFVLLG